MVSARTGGSSQGVKVRFSGSPGPSTIHSVPHEIDGVQVQEATPEAFDGIDLALFSASSAVARELGPAARQRGALVVDNSSAFRADPEWIATRERTEANGPIVEEVISKNLTPVDFSDLQ